MNKTWFTKLFDALLYALMGLGERLPSTGGDDYSWEGWLSLGLLYIHASRDWRAVDMTTFVVELRHEWRDGSLWFKCLFGMRAEYDNNNPMRTMYAFGLRHQQVLTYWPLLEMSRTMSTPEIALKLGWTEEDVMESGAEEVNEFFCQNGYSFSFDEPAQPKIGSFDDTDFGSVEDVEF